MVGGGGMAAICEFARLLGPKRIWKHLRARKGWTKIDLINELSRIHGAAIWRSALPRRAKFMLMWIARDL
jgi:hypothetical protein